MIPARIESINGVLKTFDENQPELPISILKDIFNTNNLKASLL